MTTSDARLSVDQALELLSRSAQREERETTEQAVDLFLRGASRPEERRLEAWAGAAHRLGQPSLLALHQTLSGIDGAVLATAAGRFLEQTQDAYEDVLLFLLRRSVALPRAGRLTDVRWHDLMFLQSSAVLPGAPDIAGLLSAVESWLEAWRLPALRGGGVERQLLPSSSRGFSVAVRWGQGARLLISLEGGPEAASSLLSTVADLQRMLHTAPDDPVEAKELVSPSIAQAHRALFRGQRLEQGWLRRFALVPREATRDVARAAAAMELLWLRTQAGMLLYQTTLLRDGPGVGTAERFVEQLQEAVGAPPPRGFYLSQAEPGLPAAHALEGALLGFQLSRHLRQQFDDDYFRNPAASEWLRRRLARGARETPESLRRALGIAPSAPEASSIDLTPLAAPLLAALNA